MIIGQIHSQYSKSKVSGENSTVEMIGDYLSGEHQVLYCLKSTSEISRTVDKLFAAFKFFTVDKNIVSKLQSADIILVHNQIPFCSAATIKRLSKSAMVVKIWHNYRPMCLNGSLFREGTSCQICSPQNLFIHGVVHSCYRGSKLQSIAIALHNLQMRKLLVSRLHHVAVSTFVSKKISSYGVDSRKITVIHNASRIVTSARELSPRDFLIVGRLTQEKGIIEAISLWSEVGADLKRGRKLHIVGDGDLFDLARLRFSDESIVYHGHLNESEIGKVASKCSVGLVTSLWEEPFGKVALEYLGHGLRVISTDKGGLPEILANTNSTIYDSKDPSSLMTAIRNELESPREMDLEDAQEMLKYFDHSRVAQNWLDFVSSLVNK